MICCRLLFCVIRCVFIFCSVNMMQPNVFLRVSIWLICLLNLSCFVWSFQKGIILWLLLFVVFLSWFLLWVWPCFVIFFFSVDMMHPNDFVRASIRFISLLTVCCLCNSFFFFVMILWSLMSLLFCCEDGLCVYFVHFLSVDMMQPNVLAVHPSDAFA